MGSAVLHFMAFSYSNCDGTNDRIDYVRLLISDTVATNHIFEDSEIEGAYRIQGATWQTGMFYSGSGGAFLPSSPVSYYRVAALLLDAIASNKSRLSSITQLLDVKLSPEAAAKSLRDMAECYRDMDDNSGAFAIVEQVQNPWSFRDRVWKQYQRLQGA
jgi:hypothetical protein